jgi:hypothetical protein
MLLTCGSGDWGRARSWHRSAVAAGGRQLGVAAVPWCPHRRLALIRTMLVALIAISVAALPAASEAIISSYPAEITMADQADMPCCPCCNTQGDFKATACVLKCVALAGAVLPEIVRCAAICRRRLSAFSCGRYGHDQPGVMAVVDQVEEAITLGYTVREGGRMPRRAPLHPLWRKEPPGNR